MEYRMLQTETVIKYYYNIPTNENVNIVHTYNRIQL